MPFFVFVGKIDWILVVAGIFLLDYFIVLLLGRKFKSLRSWPLLIVATLWFLTAAWEIYCEEQGYNIRVDVFLIYPLLYIASAVSLSLSISSIITCLFRQGCKK